MHYTVDWLCQAEPFNQFEKIIRNIFVLVRILYQQDSLAAPYPRYCN